MKKKSAKKSSTAATKKSAAKTAPKSGGRSGAKSGSKNSSAKVAAKASAKKDQSPKKTSKGAKPAQPKSITARIGASFGKVAEQIENIFSSRPRDIVAAIKMDHDGLRNFMGLLKDTDRDMEERRRAYAQFSALLKSHTIAEENIVYKTADQLPGREMHIKIAEGYVEHHVADDLMRRIEATTDPTEWSAHANVLSEIVEHHLKEEERDLLPLIRKAAPARTDTDMLVDYLASREQTQGKVTEKNAGVLSSLS